MEAQARRPTIATEAKRLSRVEALVLITCRKKKRYTYLDIMRALEERRDKERPRSRFRTEWPTERELKWMLAHSDYSFQIGTDSQGRALYEFKDACR
jgi:hypothetical protein